MLEPTSELDESPQCIVELRSVSKRYGEHTALDTFSLEVQRGEFLTLLGPSGSGKTTILRLVAGFEQPQTGQILINGRDAASLPPYRRNVNTVFQHYALFPHLNVFRNVAFGLEQKKLAAEAIRPRVRSILELVELPGKEDRYPHQLSGGERQRVALALAKSVADNGDVYFTPAFSGLYAPHWRTDARGIIAGLTRFANRGHIARAALEATAYQTREVLDAMVRDFGVAMRELRVDGGMVVNELLMQFQSDILGVPVVRPKVIETTALGAAYAAGLAVGFWDSPAEIEANWAEDRRWTPAMDEFSCGKTVRVLGEGGAALVRLDRMNRAQRD